MDEKGQRLLRLLFNAGEEICVSNNEFGFQSVPLEKVLTGNLTLVSPNENTPPVECKSSDLIFTAINPIKGFRRDENVTAFRSFLLELDTGELSKQLKYIEYLKVPFSAQVFSGNKSIHTVITLDEDIPDEKYYRHIGNWIFNIVGWADQNCKNPSRSIRIPGAYRDNGKKQRLINIGKRISHKELVKWLNQYKHLQPIIRAKPKIEGKSDYSRLSPWARGMLETGIVFREGRNKTWFALAVDCAKAGFSEEEAIVLLGTKYEEESDFKEKEWLTSIRSAFKYVSEGK